MEEKQRKMERKRPPSAASSPDAPDAKRVKLEPQSSESAAFLASFDFTTLPASLVTDLIVANLAAYSEAAFVDMIAAYRQRGSAPPSAPAAKESTPQPVNGHSAPSTSARPPPDAPAAMRARPPSSSVTPAPAEDRESSAPRSMSQSPPGTPLMKAEEEPVDPLKMDIDEEEIEYEPDKLNLEVCGYDHVPPPIPELFFLSFPVGKRSRPAKKSLLWTMKWSWTWRISSFLRPKSYRKRLAKLS